MFLSRQDWNNNEVIPFTAVLNWPSWVQTFFLLLTWLRLLPTKQCFSVLSDMMKISNCLHNPWNKTGFDWQSKVDQHANITLLSIKYFPNWLTIKSGPACKYYAAFYEILSLLHATSKEVYDNKIYFIQLAPFSHTHTYIYIYIYQVAPLMHHSYPAQTKLT